MEKGSEFELEMMLDTREAGRDENLGQTQETKLGSHKIKLQQLTIFNLEFETLKLKG